MTGIFDSATRAAYCRRLPRSGYRWQPPIPWFGSISAHHCAMALSRSPARRWQRCSSYSRPTTESPSMAPMSISAIHQGIPEWTPLMRLQLGGLDCSADKSKQLSALTQTQRITRPPGMTAMEMAPSATLANAASTPTGSALTRLPWRSIRQRTNSFFPAISNVLTFIMIKHDLKLTTRENPCLINRNKCCNHGWTG